MLRKTGFWLKILIKILYNIIFVSLALELRGQNCSNGYCNFLEIICSHFYKTILFAKDKYLSIYGTIKLERVKRNVSPWHKIVVQTGLSERCYGANMVCTVSDIISRQGPYKLMLTICFQRSTYMISDSFLKL